MLPGSYHPTTPEDANPRDSLNSQWQQASRRLAQIENQYRYLGLAWYSFPVEAREELLTGDAKAACDGLFKLTGKDPDGICLINSIRGLLREEAKSALRAQEMEIAAAALKRFEAISDDLSEELSVVEIVLRRAEQGYEQIRRTHGWFDACLPSEDPSEENRPEDYATFRSWVLRLPENRKALELGIADEVEAVRISTAWFVDRPLQPRIGGEQQPWRPPSRPTTPVPGIVASDGWAAYINEGFRAVEESHTPATSPIPTQVDEVFRSWNDLQTLPGAQQFR